MNKNKIIAVLFVVLMVTNFMMFVVAQDDQNEYDVNNDWFQVDVESFNNKDVDIIDDDTNSYGNLIVEKESNGERKFINKGQIEKEDEARTYSAEIIFPFTLKTSTDVNMEDVFLDYTVEEESKTKYNWLEIQTRGDLSSTGTYKYGIGWNSISVNGFNKQSNIFDGTLKINTNFDPQFFYEKGDIINLEGVDWNINKLRTETYSIELVGRDYNPKSIRSEVEIEDITTYNDNFEVRDTNKPYQSISGHNYLDLRPISATGYWSGFSGTVREWLDIYIRRMENINRELSIANEIKSQQTSTIPAVGTEWKTKDDLSITKGEYSFYLPLKISPNIILEYETIPILRSFLFIMHQVDYRDRTREVKYARINCFDGYLRNVPANYFTRIVKVGVQDIEIVMNFEAKVKIELEIEPVNDDEVDALTKNQLKSGEPFWDLIYRGSYTSQMKGTQPTIQEQLSSGSDDITESSLEFVSEFWYIVALIGIAVITSVTILISRLRKSKKSKKYRKEIK
jgi:hypothetical protein